MTTGAVVGFLHTDDFFAAPDVVATIAERFLDPAVDGVYGDLEYVSKDAPNRVIRSWVAGSFGRYSLRSGWMPPHPTLFVRRSVYDAIGGFDLRYRIAADYHSILKIFSLPSFNAHYVPRVFTCMRMGGVSNRSIANILRKSHEDWRVLRETGVGGAHTVVLKNLRKLPQFVRRTMR